jgi:hypothetical protein
MQNRNIMFAKSQTLEVERTNYGLSLDLPSTANWLSLVLGFTAAITASCREIGT